MQDKKIFNLAILSITTIGVGMIYNHSVTENENSLVEATQSVPVEVDNPKIESISRYRKYYGTLKGTKEESISPQSPAKALSVKVKKGDFVKKNQVLVVYDSSSLDDQIKIYKQAYDKTLEGFKKLKDRIQKIESNISDVENNINSKKILIESIKKDETSKENTISNLNEEIERLEKRKIELEESYSRIDLLGAEERVEQAKKVYDSVLEDKDSFSLRAPFDGIISNLNAVVGETSNFFIPSVTVSDASSAILEVKMPKSEVEYIEKGQVYGVKVSDINGNSSIKSGTVIDVSDKEDSITRLYAVKVQLNYENLNIGSSGLLEVPVETREDVMVIPKDALIRKDKKYYVYAIEEDSTAKKVEVKLGLENDTNIEVKSDILNDKMNIVVKGKEFVKENEKVKIKVMD